MAPFKSDVWRYFTIINENEAKCNFCTKHLKTSGNTSNLKSHLKTHKLKDEVPRSPIKVKCLSTTAKSDVKSKLMKFSKS